MGGIRRGDPKESTYKKEGVQGQEGEDWANVTRRSSGYASLSPMGSRFPLRLGPREQVRLGPGLRRAMVSLCRTGGFWTVASLASVPGTRAGTGDV